MTKEQILRRTAVNSGLTRVDVLVVVFVVGLLLSILVPALGKVKTAAREEVECRANLRQVGIVIQMFLQENDFIMPECLTATGSPNGVLWTSDGRLSTPRFEPGQSNRAYWGVWFNRYVEDVNIFRCPAMGEFSGMLGSFWLTLLDPYLDPSVDPKDVIEQTSFGLNGYMNRLNANSVRNQAEIIICTDHVEPRNESAHKAMHGDMFCIGAGGEDGREINLSHFRPSLRYPAPPRDYHYTGIFRHNIRNDESFGTGGRASVLWLDGRVSTIEETYGENVPNRWYDPRGIWLDIE